MAVILHDERIYPAKQRSPRTKHDAVSKQPVQRRPDTEIHQVFHENVAGVFGAGKPGLTHGKPRLHEEHKRSTEQNPDRIGRRIHHTVHIHSQKITTKEARGVQHTLAPLLLAAL